MNANTTRIETLVAELATCTTQAMVRCVAQSIIAACHDGFQAQHASDKIAELAHGLVGVQASRLYLVSDALNEHRHAMHAARAGYVTRAEHAAHDRDYILGRNI